MRRYGFGLACMLVSASAWPQALDVQFGAMGLEKLTFAGQVLEDTARWPGDQMHIWHMRCYDATGRARTDGQYGWGENNAGRSWNAASRTWSYRFIWGSIRMQYLPHGNELEMRVATSNRAGSGVTVDGASIYPVTLHLPTSATRLETGPAASSGIVDGAEQPLLASLQWEHTRATVSSADAIYGGFQAGDGGAYSVIASGTPPDALPESSVSRGRVIRPGQTDTYTVSLSFATREIAVRDTPELLELRDTWSRLHPAVLQWPDRRILGTVYLASSGQGDKNRPAGFPTNPRRYFNDPTLDVTTPEGLHQFQARLLDQAEAVVSNLRRLKAQGAITWDIEGEQYPQSTSYVCAPDEIARVAPEMESVVAPGLRFAGMKLDDAYFKTIHDAGFRVGVCVRPQRFELAQDGSARQEFLPQEKVAEELIRKMRFAHDRWGATIFYLDSTVREGGWTLPASVLEEAAKAMPDALLIPEEATPRMYGSTAPFLTFLFHGDVGLPPAVRLLYPQAFAVNLVNDVEAGKLAAHRQELVEAVRRGDILMVHAGYWQSNNATVMEIYREAGRP